MTILTPKQRSRNEKTNMKILVVEDEKDIRDLMNLHLSREGYDVLPVENGERALLELEQQKFDLLILDWTLPLISGIEICRRIRTEKSVEKNDRSYLPILMVTARVEDADVVLGLEMGADDYITKPFKLPVFLARARNLLRRSNVHKNQQENELQFEEIRVKKKSCEAFCNTEKLDLTQSEFKLLVSLVENQDRVLSRDDIIQVIQGREVNVSHRTVDMHILGLRKKLGPSSHLIETVRGFGYRLRRSGE